MGVEDLGFSNGLASGMNTAFSFLERIDAKKRREKQAVRNDLLFKQSQDDRVRNLDNAKVDRQYALDERTRVGNRRSILEGRADQEYSYQQKRRGVTDKRADTLYNLKYDSARFKLDNLKDDKLRKQALRKREDQAYNMAQAENIYNAAILAETQGNFAEAERLVVAADKLSGGLFGNMAEGVNGEMARLSEEVSTGRRPMDDPEFTAVSKRYMRPTMRNTGRDKRYDYAGLQALPDGRFAHTLQQKKGTEGLGLLDFIGDVEAPQGYNQIYGKNKSAKLDKMSLNEVIAFQRGRVKKGSKSSAVGRYQFLSKTLNSLKSELGLKGNEKFTPDLQDKLGMQLLKRRGYDDFKAGKIDSKQFANNLAKEWASMPVVSGKKKGGSYYSGDGLNKSLVRINDFLAAVEGVGAVVDKNTRVPATAAQSADPQDHIVARTQQELIQEVQMGATAEREMMGKTSERLKRILLRKAALGGKLPAGLGGGKQVSGKDRYIKAGDGQMFDTLTQKFIAANSQAGGGQAGGKAEYKEDSNGRLYNKYTGEYKNAEEGAGGFDLSNYAELDPREVSVDMTKSIPGLSPTQQKHVFAELEGLETPEEKQQLTRHYQDQHLANELTADLTSDTSLDSNNPIGAEMATIQSIAKQAEVSDEALGRMVKEAVKEVGTRSPDAILLRVKQDVAKALSDKELRTKIMERAHNTTRPTDLYGSGAH